jgi:hypothetical protein
MAATVPDSACGTTASFFSAEGADLELLLVLLQDGLVVVFPELLAGIFAGNSLEDCG